MSDGLHVTRRQLRLLVAVAAALEEVFGIRLLHNWERRGDDRFWFGIEEDVPGTPYVELVHHDDWGDDTWSGRISDIDTFSVKNLPRPDGRFVYLEFRSQESSLAGRLEDVHGSFPAPILSALRTAWSDAIARDLAVPRNWTWLLPDDDGGAGDSATQGRTIG